MKRNPKWDVKKNQQIRYEQSVVINVKRRTFCIMGQRVRKKSKLNPLGGGSMKMSIQCKCS